MRKVNMRLSLIAIMMVAIMIPGSASKAASVDASKLQTVSKVKSEREVNTSKVTSSTIEAYGIFTTKYIVTAKVLNVRSGPSTKYAVTGYLYKNDVVKVYSISEGWAKFKQDGQWRYVSATYLKKK